MKYFYLYGGIEDELMDKFYNFCNQNDDDDWSISISSGGGVTTIGKNIVNIINQRSDRVTLICHEAYSAAFEILYKSKCKKVLIQTCKGMYHLSAVKMSIKSNLKPEFSEDVAIFKNWKDSTWQIDMAKEFLTDNELKKYKKGHDIYFTFKRMKQIFPNAQVI